MKRNLYFSNIIVQLVYYISVAFIFYMRRKTFVTVYLMKSYTESIDDNIKIDFDSVLVGLLLQH